MLDSETLLKELLETFQQEAQDHLGALSTLLVALEREPGAAERRQLTETIYRRVHTLKGAAHAVNLPQVASQCQELENLLADLKRGEIGLELGLFDRLHADLDLLAGQILTGPGAPAPPRAAGTPPAGAPEPTPVAKPQPEPKAPAEGRRQGAGQQAPSAGAETAAPVPAPISDPYLERREAASQETVRVPVRLLEELLLQAEELVSAKLAAATLLEELSAGSADLAGSATRDRAGELAGQLLKRPEGEPAARRLAGVVQELCDRERRSEQRLKALEKGAEHHLWALRGMVDPLLEQLKHLNLLPFATLTDPFAKLIRDLCRELDKEAELSCSGVELEIDRRILAELKEPLLHIVRNVMDHGIEKAAERVERGKPARSRVSIELRLQDAGRACLVIADDGRGIDPVQVRGTALRMELITPEAAESIGESELLQLIFESGFSTSPMITSLSGRGLGLAIVREALERLGGHVTVSARPGQGTEFRLELPLSFAMIRGLRVRCGGRLCILPAGNVELTARLARDRIKSVENRDTVVLNGEVLSLVSLARVLELGQGGADEEEPYQQVVLLKGGDKRLAFAVDQVDGVQEVLVKPLGSQLARVRNVAGATVLGNGVVVPILNINDLLRSALLSPRGAAAEAARGGRPKRLSVLVAEDSITSRTLLKNILEASGFQVATAIDGADALAQLKTEPFDIVISDVEMPRLDGFQLTAAIRGDQRLAELPVILVTGLESRADRERGIEVGANAYVVKSSFDQSSLVEVIQKLT